MFYQSHVPRDLLTELGKLQQEMQRSMQGASNIRGVDSSYPKLNVGGTPNTIEVFAFVPGIDPDKLDIQLEKDTLSISGERVPEKVPDKTIMHIGERFSGKFRRIVSLPEDADPDGIEAQYRDGVLHITISRCKAVQPRRITVK